MYWPKFTKALLFLFIIMKGILPAVLFFQMLCGCMERVTGCSGDDWRGRSCTHIPGTSWLPRLAALGFGEHSQAGGKIPGKGWGGTGQLEPPSILASPEEAPTILFKALCEQPVTTDRVVPHCNSMIRCRNNFSTVKTQQMFEASSEGRLRGVCLWWSLGFVLLATWTMLLRQEEDSFVENCFSYFVLFFSCSLTGDIELYLGFSFLFIVL